MNIYCTLHIRSDLFSELPNGFLIDREMLGLKYTDHAAPEVLARRRRVRNELGLREISIPRHHWALTSDGQVDSDDPYEHIHWLLQCVRADVPLDKALSAGFEYWLSMFWAGGGSGGGPLITLQTSKLLVRHGVDLGVAFYANL